MGHKEDSLAWYYRNKEYSNARVKEWRNKNLSKARAACRKYDQSEKGTLSRKRRYKTQVFRRSNLLRYYKERPCADCGDTYNYWQMDFDHRPGTIKTKAVGAIRLNGLKGLLAEIAKCDVVCANCHRNRTHIRRKNHVIDLSQRNR